ncbi:MAG: DUF6776 family protein [Stenotrophobium sp.]
MKHRIVIASHRPWLRPVLIAVISALLALLGWGLYAYTRTHTVSDFARTQTEVEQLRDERRQLTHDLREAQSQIATLKDQLVYAQQSTDIDTQACAIVKTSLPKLQGEVADLHEQLAFYRGIVSPDQSRAGVRVYNLKMLKGASANAYRYELVLIQSVRHDKRIDGRISVTLEGLQGSTRRMINLADIAGDGGKNLLFSFTYFQEIDGQLKLPDGFKPLRVSVKLTAEVDGAPEVEDDFDWDKIATG